MRSGAPLPDAPVRRVEAFLSHSDRNRAFARRIVDVLARHGVRTWYAPRELRGSQIWHDEIGRALARSNWFVLLLSRASVASKWVKHELLYAVRHEQYNGHIVPVVLETCNWQPLSWTLDESQFIRGYRRGFDHGSRELLRTWGIRYRPDATRAPPSPR